MVNTGNWFSLSSLLRVSNEHGNILLFHGFEYISVFYEIFQVKFALYAGFGLQATSLTKNTILLETNTELHFNSESISKLPNVH